MGRVYGLLAGAILPIAVALVPAPRAHSAEPPPPPPLKIGMPECMFSGLPPAVVQTASRPFQTMFEKQTGLKGEVVIAKDYADLTAQLRAGKLDIGVLHGVEYAWVKQHPDLVPLLVTVPTAKLQGCVVVNVASQAKSADELKGDCVAIPTSTKAHCRVFFDRLKAKLPDGTCGTAKLDGKTVEDALDAVSGGTCKSALVDASALRAYKRDKPGAGDQLKVLVESDPFPSAIIVHRKDAFDAKTAAMVRDGLIKGTQTAQGQLLTSLWRLKGFAPVSPEYLTDLDTILKAYPAPK